MLQSRAICRQLFEWLAFHFAHFPQRGQRPHVNVARPVAFEEMVGSAAKVQQVELVNQAVAVFRQINRTG